MARAKIKPSELARELGVSRASVYKWLAGDVLPHRRYAHALQARLGLHSFAVSNMFGAPPSSAARRLPLMEGTVVTGPLGPLVAKILQTNWLEADDTFSGEAFGFRLDDDRMEPEFHGGEIVIVDPQVEPRDGDYVIAELQNPQDAAQRIWTFNQFRVRGRHRGQEVFDLVPLNPSYGTITVSPALPGRIVGTLVEHRRRLRMS